MLKLAEVEVIPHHKADISTRNLQIHAQIHKSGGSRDIGGIFRLSIVRIVIKNKLAFVDGTKRGELLLLLLILTKSDKP
jgi:hypothetical protein